MQRTVLRYSVILALAGIAATVIAVLVTRTTLPVDPDDLLDGLQSVRFFALDGETYVTATSDEVGRFAEAIRTAEQSRKHLPPQAEIGFGFPDHFELHLRGDRKEMLFERESSRTWIFRSNKLNDYVDFSSDTLDELARSMRSRAHQLPGE